DPARARAGGAAGGGTQDHGRQRAPDVRHRAEALRHARARVLQPPRLVPQDRGHRPRVRPAHRAGLRSAMPTDSRQPFPVFDSDSHLLETAAVWDRYLESEYRVLARTWFWHAEGEAGPYTILNGRPAPGLPLGNI